MKTARYLGFVVPVAACLLAGLAYQSPMLLDDLDQVSHIRGISCLNECLGPDCYGLLRPTKNLLFYVAITQSAHPDLVAHSLSGVLFLAAGLMLYLWLRMRFSSRHWAVAGVALWGLAPTLVSSVTWFSCANILLAVVFALSTLCLWEHARRGAENGRPLRAAALLAAAACSYAVAFLSYEAVVAIPVLCLLQDLSGGRRLRSRVSALFGVTAAAWVAASLLVRLVLVGVRNLSNSSIAPVSDARLVAAAPFFLLDHVRMWLFPFGRQEILATYVAGASVSGTELVLSWIGLGLWLLLSAVAIRRWPRIAFGSLWVVATLVPVCNFLPLRSGPFADYFLTLPSIGIVYLILEAVRLAGGAAREPARPIGRAAYACLALLLLWRGGAAAAAFQWAANWAKPEELYRVSLQSRPHAYQARANLAQCLNLDGKYAEAEALARQARQEAPWYTFSYNVLGDVLNQTGRHREAFESYAAAVSNGVADVYTHYALAYTADTWLDDRQTALTHFRMVTESAKSDFRERAFSNLGRIQAQQGRTDAAMMTFKRGLSEFPNSMLLHHNISVAYSAQGDQRLARIHRAEAERLRASGTTTTRRQTGGYPRESPPSRQR